MTKLEKLEMMDKILRELEDLRNSQVSVMKKIAQIEVDNMNLGAAVLEKSLPEIHGKVDDNVTLVSQLEEEFTAHRDQFFADNNLGAVIDPTA